MKEQKEIFENLLSEKPSGWLEKAEFRKQNKNWLKKSTKIAFKILRELRAKKMTQKELAVLLDVSPQYVNKIVKGRENLQLDTISRLEQILGITLIEIPGLSSLNLTLSGSSRNTVFTRPKMFVASKVSLPSKKEKFESYTQVTSHTG